MAIDVTIRGAGIFGLSIAWVLLCRGAQVRIIDPNGPGAGASGGIVGALAPHVPENWNAKKAFQLRSLLSAETFWTGIAQAGGIDPGYARSGRLQPLADDNAVALAHARARSAATLWQGQADWCVERSDDQPISAPSGWLVRDTLSARIHPARACRALAAAIETQGGIVAREGLNEGAVVWATGAAGLAALSQDLGREVGRGIKGQAALLAYSAPHMPQLFVDGLHVVPHADGTIAVGSTTERDFDTPDRCDAQTEGIVARIRSSLPWLEDAPVVARWAGLRPRARSRAPMLGPWPGRPGHFVANGGFKIGFGMAPEVARVMADLILDGHDTIPEGFAVADNL
ncbi:FAD-binding oxidoreductase [Palleronia sp. LCG004]|uniref:NAD(P)/FAD-dependent oxidoreductase n=1 Tax=Palleronia sp. LCG004 TaxID=3079304 RepID=UPI002942AC81|nr:FAD-binding oxidoreductase [Palleronia sp. LCG004]WOI55460.1 FAD-binding oxidoreductase [Palleronia sp. LCG004]